MLERIPKTKLVFDKASPHTRKMIEAAIRIQTPIVEGIRPEHFCEDFKAVAEILDLPIKPNSSITRFAAEVAQAWDALSLQDKKGAGIHPVFFRDPNKLAANFFGTGAACSQRMGLVIHKAEKLQKQLEIYRLLKKCREKEVTFEQFDNGMRRLGIAVSALWLPVENGVIYTGTTEFSKVTENILDLDKALSEAETQELKLRLEIARRLALGYNPAL